MSYADLLALLATALVIGGIVTCERVLTVYEKTHLPAPQQNCTEWFRDAGFARDETIEVCLCHAGCRNCVCADGGVR